MTANCPHCDAVPYREAYKPGLPPPRKWLCGTTEAARTSKCYEAQIVLLETKLATIPPAKPLVWKKIDGILQAKSISVGFGVFPAGDLMRLCFSDFRAPTDFDDIADAQAHAEQLHQEEWRKQNEKWRAV